VHANICDVMGSYGSFQSLGRGEIRAIPTVVQYNSIWSLPGRLDDGKVRSHNSNQIVTVLSHNPSIL
jgi:hypothetical protein